MTLSTPSPNDDVVVEPITENATFRWLHNKRIAFLEFRRIVPHVDSAPIRQRIDATIDNWPADYPIMLLYQFHEISWSPQLRKNAEQDYRRIPPDKRAYLAVVLPKGPMSQILRLFMRGQERTKGRQQPISTATFMNLEEAKEWLIGEIKLIEA